MPQQPARGPEVTRRRASSINELIVMAGKQGFRNQRRHRSVGNGNFSDSHALLQRGGRYPVHIRRARAQTAAQISRSCPHTTNQCCTSRSAKETRYRNTLISE